MKKDLISGVVWVGIFCTIFLMARALPESVAPYPTMIATVGFFLCLLQLGIFTQRYVKTQKQVAAGIREPEKKKSIPIEQTKRSVLAGGLLLGYGLCFSLLGYILSTALFLFGFMHLLAPAQENKEKGKKDLIQELLVAVILTAVIYVLFEIVLKVRFPKGIFAN